MRLQITENRFGFKPEQLFCIGKRDNNPERSFLFISKLLGKHISTDPEIVKATGYLLSSLKYGFPNKSFVECITAGGVPDYTMRTSDVGVLVIGFCETATALGMSVASSIKGAYYQTTTREKIVGHKHLLSFEEAHSHASTHSMYNDRRQLSDFEKIILVDDEITTGNSILHLIAEIIKQCDVKDFSIMTILDWRGDEDCFRFESFAQTNNLNIEVYSIMAGNIQDMNPELMKNDCVNEVKEITTSFNLNIFNRISLQLQDLGQVSCLKDSGILGISTTEIESIEKRAAEVAVEILRLIGKKGKYLVLGHGENIYIPSRIASCLKSNGCEILFRTTSRTPIYCDGEIILDAETFTSHGDIYHFYNKREAEMFDAVILIADYPFQHKLCNNLMIFNA